MIGTSRERKSQGNPFLQYNLVLYIYIYIYIVMMIIENLQRGLIHDFK